MASKKIDVLFLSDTDCKTSLQKDAKNFFKEEEKNMVSDEIEIVELTHPDHVPEAWMGEALLWGTDEEITAVGFLSRSKDPEYERYLELKKEFEKGNFTEYIRLQEKFKNK